ncbi:hypothetical protein Tco_1164880 [Tanacetum coccineum]
MSSGLSSSMTEVAAMSESAFRKRFRSSYESSPSVSPPDHPSRKRYQTTSELVEDSEEDEEIGESMDSDSVSEDAEDKGPTAEDEDPTAEYEGLTTGVKGPGMDDESYGLDDEGHGLDDEGHGVESHGLSLEEEEAVPGESERPERVSASRQPTLTSWTDPKDGMVYMDVLAYPPPPPVQTPPLPEWMSGSLLISTSPFVIPSPISSTLTVPSPVATPAALKTKGFLTELGAQVKMQGGLIHDHAVRLEEISHALFERSDGCTESSSVWHAISDMQGENQDLWLLLAEERRARLELAEVVDGIRRGQEPRGDA